MSASRVVAVMRGTAVRARPLNGISASAARYSGIVLVAMPNLMQPTRPTLQCSFVHACARRFAHASGAHPMRAPALSRLPSVNNQTLQIRTVRFGQSARSWIGASIGPELRDAGRAAIALSPWRLSASTATCPSKATRGGMTLWLFRRRLTGVVSQRPDPPTPASAPFQVVTLHRVYGTSECWLHRSATSRRNAALRLQADHARTGRRPMRTLSIGGLDSPGDFLLWQQRGSRTSRRSVIPTRLLLRAVVRRPAPTCAVSNRSLAIRCE